MTVAIAGASGAQQPNQEPKEIGGQKIVKLTRQAVSKTKPEFTSVTVLPGRGMDVLQITANFPGKGEVNVLYTPPLQMAAKMLDEHDTPNGDGIYRFGAALLFPYPNRIRGPLSADGKTLTTEWHGRKIQIPANNGGMKPGTEKHALHGLILKEQTDEIKVKEFEGGQEVIGIIHGGDFKGQWFSKSDLTVTVTLTADAVDTTIEAHNVGTEDEPVAMAWHPYFNIPSGDRAQARVHIPAKTFAEVDNYDNVFPTGKLSKVDGTKFDFRAAEGRALGTEFFDDNWNTLEWKGGAATVVLTDPKAGYGVKIEGLSPQIKAIQLYSPTTGKFAAIEHQFNLADPFNQTLWGKTDTGMVTLKPGQSTKWHVRLKVFVP
jgi:galactose mutarotase-like enzyme